MSHASPHISRDPPGSGSRSRCRTVAIALLTLAVVWFAWRGPINALGRSVDFILIYTPARAWMHGQNPYDMRTLDRVWEEAGGPYILRPTERYKGNLIYPPSTLVMFAPWALFPWPAAKWAWVASNLAFLAIVLGGSLRLAGWRLGETRSLAFLALSLSLTPVHTAFRLGQTPLFVLATAMLALTGVRPWRSGLCNGLAAAIKPQIGLPFIALQAVHGKWKSVVMSLVAAASLFGVGAAAMSAAGIDWLGAWRSNLANFTGSGEGDPTAANPLRSQLLNLHYPLHTLFDGAAVVNAMTLGICGLIAAVFFLFLRLRSKETSSDDGRSPQRLLEASMVAVLCLLVVYHRFYDAALLILPLMWAVQAIAVKDAASRHAAWCVMALMIPFFLNSTAALLYAAQRFWLPERLTAGRVWDVFIMPHEVWALLAMALCLLWARAKPVRGDQA